MEDKYLITVIGTQTIDGESDTVSEPMAGQPGPLGAQTMSSAQEGLRA